MSNHVHLSDDLAAMAETCWGAFVAPEQESVLVELLKFRETPDNNAFIREFGLPDLDADTEFWAILEPSRKVEEEPACSED